MSTEESTEEREDEEPGGPPIASRSRLRWVVAGVVAVLAGVAIVVAVLQSTRVSDLREDRDALRAAEEVRSTAGAFGEAYLTYDHDDLEASRDRLLALVTDRFAASFEESQVPGLEELFSNLQTTTDATTKEVFVSDVGEREARALVVVDITASSAATGDQVLTDLSFVLQMEEVGGAWKVDEVAPAPQPDVSGDTANDGEAPTAGS